MFIEHLINIEDFEISVVKGICLSNAGELQSVLWVRYVMRADIEMLVCMSLCMVHMCVFCAVLC